MTLSVLSFLTGWDEGCMRGGEGRGGEGRGGGEG